MLSIPGVSVPSTRLQKCQLTDFYPAHGILVPLLETAEDAKKLVQSAKFPPSGTRGFGSPFPMERFGGPTMTEYLQQANDSLVTIVQIETKEALDNVRFLANTPSPSSSHAFPPRLFREIPPQRATVSDFQGKPELLIGCSGRCYRQSSWY